MSHYSLLGAATEDVEDGGDDGTKGVQEPDAGVWAAAREPCQRTQGSASQSCDSSDIISQSRNSQIQDSEQQLENLVRELKAAPANHMPVHILLANHITARCRNSEQQLENLIREHKAACQSQSYIRQMHRPVLGGNICTIRRFCQPLAEQSVDLAIHLRNIPRILSSNSRTFLGFFIR